MVVNTASLRAIAIMADKDYVYPDARLLIFAKAPVAGQVKTRLLPVLSAEQAAALHRQLVAHSVATLLASRLAPVVLYVSDDDDFWSTLGDGFEVQKQCGGDLGERMHQAISDQLALTNKVVLIGSDCPFITADYLSQALAELSSPRPKLVLGPAADGGYVLIAANAITAQVFCSVNWGSEHVLVQTLAQIIQLGWQYCCLPELNDIDRPEDLALLKVFEWGDVVGLTTSKL